MPSNSYLMEQAFCTLVWIRSTNLSILVNCLDYPGEAISHQVKQPSKAFFLLPLLPGLYP